MSGTVAVDFDGVIHAYSKGWHDGTIYDGPLPGAFDALRTLMGAYAVMIHTTREPPPVARWIKERSGIETSWSTDENQLGEFWNGRDTILVTRRKLPALAYIDDRAIRFTSWGPGAGRPGAGDPVSAPVRWASSCPPARASGCAWRSSRAATL